MDIISLLPFFIFLLFVFLTIFRTRQRLKSLAKSNKKNTKSRKPLLESKKSDGEKPGWKSILIDAYEQIQREIKEAQKQKETIYDKPERARKKTSPGTILWEKEPLIPSPPPIPSSKEIKKKKPSIPSEKPEIVSTQKLKAAKSVKPLIEKPTIQDLRKAVVWSEILAPPLALRKEEDPF